MRAIWLRVGTIASPLIFSANLFAQTLPVLELPREEPSPAGPIEPVAEGAARAAPEAAPARVRPPTWEYNLGLGAGWDSNIDFRVPDGPSGSVLSPRGSLARVFWGPKGDLRLAGTGSWLGYPEQEELNRYYADLRVEGSHRPSPRTTWRVNGFYSFGYNDSSLVLSDQGVLLPLVQTRTLGGALGVTRRLGERTSFRLDGRLYRTEFDQEESQPLGLIDGQSIRGIAGLERRLGLRDTVALEYSLEGALGRNLPEGGGSARYYLTHYGSMLWSHLLSPRHGVLLEAGASYTPDAAQVGLDGRESFYGGASYHRRVGRSVVTLFVRREVVPAFGLGLMRVANRLGLDAAIALGPAWRLRLTGTHIMPQTPEGAAVDYSTPDEAFMAIERSLGRRFQISGEARYRRRSAAGTIPEIGSLQAGVFLAVVSPGREAAPRSTR